MIVTALVIVSTYAGIIPILIEVKEKLYLVLNKAFI